MKRWNKVLTVSFPYSIPYPELPHHVVIGKACRDSTRSPIVLVATFPVGKGAIYGGKNYLVAELL